MKRLGIAFVLLTVWGMNSPAQNSFQVTDQIRLAYDEILKLRLDRAQELIDRIKTEDQGNLLVFHIENYIDFFRLFILEDKSLFLELEKNKSFRIDKIKQGDSNSPYYKFSQAEILMQWALVRSKFYDDVKFIDLTLLNDLNRAYRLLEANDKEFPNFLANKKSLSLFHSLSSYLPGIVRKIFQVRGSLDEGQEEIEYLIRQMPELDFLFKNEAYAISAYIYLHLLNQPEKARQSLMEMDLDPEESPLAVFLMASFSLKAGFNEEALDYLERRKSSTGQLNFYFLDLLEGKARLNRLDTSAGFYLSRFIDRFKGRHFIKEAYQKLAWYELVVKEDSNGYHKYMKRCLESGSSLLEDDQQAMFEARQNQLPEINLLKARLLFDGGYHAKALELLESSETQISDSPPAIGEKLYRLGRIHQEMGNLSIASSYFLKVMAMKKLKGSFFVANSCLQLALILEELDRPQDAMSYYKSCLKLKSKSYEDQIHQKAKAGKKRITMVLRSLQDN